MCRHPLFGLQSLRSQDGKPVTEHPTPSCGCSHDHGQDHHHDVVDAPSFNDDVPHATRERPLNDVARRALMEAAERRAVEFAAAESATEYGGPRGPEPTRFGDWEKKGIAVDF